MFNVGDEWLGTFSTVASGAALDGGLELEVTRVVGPDVTFFATFVHGQFCNVNLGCRTAGVSQFYMTGTLSGLPSSLSLFFVFHPTSRVTRVSR